ncbi:MAG: NAD(P)/FAD-dependent oxidoreductase [Calditrichia bacterium]
MNDSVYDVVIIGAGPAGLTAGIFAHNKNLKLHLVEGLKIGGQLKNLYPHKPVYNYPGHSRINAGDLSELMYGQIRENEISVSENLAVSGIEAGNNGRLKVITSQNTLTTHSVILACGMGLFQPRRLDVAGEDELENKSLFYTVEEPVHWENKEAAVFGGGNSAVDNAMLLHEKGCRVTLVHQLTNFQAEAASVKKLENSTAEILTGWKTLVFGLKSDKISITLQHKESGEKKEILKDRALVNIGIKPDLSFLKELDVAKNGRQIKVDTEMQTSIPGIFGCGDVVDYPGKVRLIVTAIGEAATAVNSTERYLKTLK